MVPKGKTLGYPEEVLAAIRETVGGEGGGQTSKEPAKVKMCLPHPTKTNKYNLDISTFCIKCNCNLN